MDAALRTAISGSFDKTAKLWDLRTGKCIDTYQHEHFVFGVGLHKSGSVFYSYDSDYCLHFFATADRSLKEIKTADLKAAARVKINAPALDHRKGLYSWTKVSAKKDLSCFAANVLKDGSQGFLVDSFMWA